MLNVLDEKWKDHLYDLDQLRAAIHYRSWGQKDPLVEYKGEAYTMFVDLMHDVADTFTDRSSRPRSRSTRATTTPSSIRSATARSTTASATSAASRACRPSATTRSASSRPIPADELLAMLAQLEGDGANGDGHGPHGDDDIVEASYDDDDGVGNGRVLDVGPSEPPDVRAVSKPDPAI
jgi:preprotein translocase subunit SecA